MSRQGRTAREETNNSLETLLGHSGSLQRVQEGAKESLSEIEELRETVSRLKEKHGILKRKLIASRGTQTVKDKILERINQGQIEPLTEKALTVATEKVLEKIISKNIEQNSDQLKIANRLTGKTLFQKDNKLGIRFETFTSGKFHQSYYVFFDYNKKEKKLFITNHTIPFFIPIQKISDTLLNRNIRFFAESISDYLNAYMDRSQQFRTIRELIPEVSCLDRNFQCNDSFDYLEFNYVYKKRIFEFKIIYDDLKETRPERLAIFTENDGKRQRWRNAEKEFKVHDLADAFKLVFLKK